MHQRHSTGTTGVEEYVLQFVLRSPRAHVSAGMQRLVEATLSQFPSSRLRRDITDCLVGLLHELAAVDGARGVRRTVLDAATRHLGFRRQAVRTVTALVTFGGATLGYSEQLFFSLSRLRLDQDAEVRQPPSRSFT